MTKHIYTKPILKNKQTTKQQHNQTTTTQHKQQKQHTPNTTYKTQGYKQTQTKTKRKQKTTT